MRCLERNKVTFYYALYEGKSLLYDDQGYETGEYEDSFNNPVKCLGNVSPASGVVTAEQFGGNETYDKIIVLDNPETPIDEYSRLWIDTMPTLVSGATETPHDYVVRKVARSLNSVSIACTKVAVSEG